MASLYLLSFLLGLLLVVGAMLYGVERRGSRVVAIPGRRLPANAVGDSAGAIASRPVAREEGTSPRARWNLPVWAAFATIFGLTGYLLTRHSELGARTLFVIAALVGVAAVTGAIALIARWAIPTEAKAPPDVRYVLQGHVACVTTGIDEAGMGEIVYEVDGVRYASSARSVDGGDVAPHADVVIDRIESGVAYVEPWARVEERL